MQLSPSTFQTVPTSIRFLRRRDVETLLSISKSTIYAKLDKKCPSFDPRFPAPVKLSGSSTVRWVEAEVLSWAASRIEASRIQVN
jgi:prophage regulatory protein